MCTRTPGPTPQQACSGGTLLAPLPERKQAEGLRRHPNVDGAGVGGPGPAWPAPDSPLAAPHGPPSLLWERPCSSPWGLLPGRPVCGACPFVAPAVGGHCSPLAWGSPPRRLLALGRHPQQGRPCRREPVPLATRRRRTGSCRREPRAQAQAQPPGVPRPALWAKLGAGRGTGPVGGREHSEPWAQPEGLWKEGGVRRAGSGGEPHRGPPESSAPPCSDTCSEPQLLHRLCCPPGPPQGPATGPGEPLFRPRGLESPVPGPSCPLDTPQPHRRPAGCRLWDTAPALPPTCRTIKPTEWQALSRSFSWTWPEPHPPPWPQGTDVSGKRSCSGWRGLRSQPGVLWGEQVPTVPLRQWRVPGGRGPFLEGLPFGSGMEWGPARGCARHPADSSSEPPADPGLSALPGGGSRGPSVSRGQLRTEPGASR